MSITKADVHSFLASHNALIVHFASSPFLMGMQHVFPDSLHHVLAAHAAGAPLSLACSAITPSDQFGIASSVRNGTGTVGLVLRPQQDSSVIAVGHKDAGSQIDPATQKRIFPRQTLTRAKLDDSLHLRGTVDGPSAAYNEWGIENYDVIGVFTAFDTNNDVIISGPMMDYLDRAHVQAIFPSLSMYQFRDGHIVEIDGYGTPTIVPHARLYP